MSSLTPHLRKEIRQWLYRSNEMKETIHILQKLKRFDYSVFQFTDYYAPMNATLQSFMESNGQHLIHVAKTASHIVNTASNVCDSIWKESHYNGELPIDNDGVLFTCLQSLFRYHPFHLSMLENKTAIRAQ